LVREASKQQKSSRQADFAGKKINIRRYAQDGWRK
jgi:hypothetical protein